MIDEKRIGAMANTVVENRKAFDSAKDGQLRAEVLLVEQVLDLIAPALPELTSLMAGTDVRAVIAAKKGDDWAAIRPCGEWIICLGGAFSPTSLGAVLKHFKAEDIIAGLLFQLEGQAFGSLPKRTVQITARVAKLRALTELLRGL